PARRPPVLAIFGGQDPGILGRDLPRECFRKHPHVVLQRTACDRNVNMQSARTRGLNVTRHLQLVEASADQEGSLDDPAERRRSHRIEIEMQEVGPMDIIAPGIPRIEVYAAQINYPQQRCQVTDNRKADYVSGGMLDRADLYPIRPWRGRSLHE